jgi:hypothetical protein
MRKKQTAKEMTEESPPCVIYPKGGKETLEVNLEKRKGKDKVS